MGTLSTKNHTCDDDCINCCHREDCEHINYEQFGFDFALDTEMIDWNTIPEVDVAPETSRNLSENSTTLTHSQNLKEIELQVKKEIVENKKSNRIINQFLKNYSAKLLKYSIIVIIALYIIDLLVSIAGRKNSEFADRLFTLLQMIITTNIGYLIGTNQEKE